MAWLRSKRPPKRPTQRDIAELAGVSITTVSHVVNGTRAVAPETRAAVLEAVEQTGYTGDVIARSLVTGGTRSIGVALTQLSDPYFAVLLQAIERAAAAAGYTVLLSSIPDTPETEHTIVRTLLAHRVEGLLLTPALGDDALIDELISLAIPVVLLDRLTMRSDIDQVGAENVQSTSVLTEHLAAHGHQRIGFISGAPGLPTSEERGLGYRLGLGRAGLPWSAELIACGYSETGRGAQAFAALLDQPQPATAVVVADDAMLAGVLHETRRRQLRIGQDVAVVGSDDTVWTDLVEPPLTTMAQPIADIGDQAVRLLLNRVHQPDRTPETIRLPPVLQQRQSCGCGPVTRE